ncbi:hypothetical protein EMCRGX_G014890 [Ephydatia muelleri]|eukprot:Em0005g1128a
MQGLNSPGAPDCIYLEAPCGNVAAETAHVYFSKGDNISVVFQKNLDHFYSQSPGQFIVSLAQLSDAPQFEKVLTIPDDKQPSLTLYTPNITLPSTLSGPVVLQVVYVTNNPQAPASFYQCADIRVI